MRRFRFSLSTLVLAVAVVAATCGIVRWGLGLPNHLANYAIQPIVIGSAPTAALLGLGLLLTLRDRARREGPRPFWLGFMACGAIAVVAYAADAVFISPTYQHHSVFYEKLLNAALRRCGMTWDPRDPGAHAVRYAIVITGLVVLLALPQVLFATLGGWIVERNGWARRAAARPQKSVTDEA